MENRYSFKTEAVIIKTANITIMNDKNIQDNLSKEVISSNLSSKFIFSLMWLC